MRRKPDRSLRPVRFMSRVKLIARFSVFGVFRGTIKFNNTFTVFLVLQLNWHIIVCFKC